MPFDPEQFSKIVQATLTPQEYQQWLQNIAKPSRKDQPCLVDAFFQKEAEKPMELRSAHCMISCPCHKCSPYHM